MTSEPSVQKLIAEENRSRVGLGGRLRRVSLCR